MIIVDLCIVDFLKLIKHLKFFRILKNIGNFIKLMNIHTVIRNLINIWLKNNMLFVVKIEQEDLYYGLKCADSFLLILMDMIYKDIICLFMINWNQCIQVMFIITYQ